MLSFNSINYNEKKLVPYFGNRPENKHELFSPEVYIILKLEMLISVKDTN